MPGDQPRRLRLELDKGASVAGLAGRDRGAAGKGAVA